jgi:hypothetical protein
MTPATNAQRQAALKARRKAQGLVRVQVWVPAASAQSLRNYAEGMCCAYAELSETSGLCSYCARFFTRFRCNKPNECDCPKCQGYCECGETPRADAAGLAKEHYAAQQKHYAQQKLP